MINWVFLTLFIIVVCINIFTQIKLSKSVDYQSKQKLFQSILLWLIPFFGAYLILKELDKYRKHEENFYKEFTNRYN